MKMQYRKEQPHKARKVLLLLMLIIAVSTISIGCVAQNEQEMKDIELEGNDKIAFDIFLKCADSLVNASQWRLVSGTLAPEAPTMFATLISLNDGTGSAYAYYIFDGELEEARYKTDWYVRENKKQQTGSGYVSIIVEAFEKDEGLGFQKINQALDEYWKAIEEGTNTDEMTKDDRLAYEIILKCTYSFDDPSQIRVIAGYLWKNKSIVYAHITSPTGYAKGLFGYYILDGEYEEAALDTSIIPLSDEERCYYPSIGLHFDRINKALEEYWKNN